jgi:succinyl-CoA synthetase beta subunit
MYKPILIPFIIIFGFITFAEDIFAQEVYKSVDEKGTINFSDSPTSPVVTRREGAAKQDGAEVLKKSEVANKRTLTDDDVNAILLKRPTWRGSASSGGVGGSGTVRTGRS